jgi:hypothetical protein
MGKEKNLYSEICISMVKVMVVAEGLIKSPLLPPMA